MLQRLFVSKSHTFSLVCFSLLASLLLLAPVKVAFATPHATQDQATQDQEEVKATATAPNEKPKPISDEENSDAEKKEDKDELPSSDNFVRILENDDEKPVALQTSVTRFKTKNEKGEEVIVDLIGVVHIGEYDYYKELNESFKQYDALLYELVAPEGTRIPEGGVREPGFNPISGLQNTMKEMLELEFQLEKIDYNKDNFVHADMSPEEFMESMTNNNESFAKMFFKLIGQSMAQQGKSSGPSDIGLLMAYFSDDRAIKMRQMMATQMQSMGMSMTAFNGDNGSTIITHRNGKAFEVLEREIKAGKTKLGVFYGAGHLPDMEARLLKDFKMKQVGEREWLTAWRLTREPASQRDQK